MSGAVWIREMRLEDVPGVIALQRLAFPPPFPEEFLWSPEHLVRHIELFPEGQFVADGNGQVLGSCSNTVISEHVWRAHGSWDETVGGPELRAFAPSGSTLYGLDISVHPDHRRTGIGRRFYQARFDLLEARGLKRYGTGCRIPDYKQYEAAHAGTSVHEYVHRVVSRETVDRTLTPLLKYGLAFVDVIENYMTDEESGNAAALLEWMP